MTGMPCDTTGAITDVPVPHTHRCVVDKSHKADGSTEDAWHACACGTKWTDVQELEAVLELTDGELRDVAKFLEARDYAIRMNAFSIDLDGGLVRRIGRLLERMRGETR